MSVRSDIKKRSEKFKSYKNQANRLKIRGVKQSRQSRINDSTRLNDNDLTSKYRVSYHAALRFHHRVMGIDEDVELSYENIEKAAQFICINFDVKLDDNSQGNYPFLDDFLAVIKNGIVVTIIYKKK